MSYPSLMYLHFVMEAQECFHQALAETTTGIKLDKLAAGFEALKQASACGAPEDILHELRLRYYEEFLNVANKEQPPIP